VIDVARTPKQLTGEEAKRTLAHRFASRADGLRQLATRFGVRPYNVWLVWGVWSGRERGAGSFKVLREIPIVPNPVVQDLTAISLDPRSAGVLPVGSVRLTRVSATYSAAMLSGMWTGTDPADRLPDNVEFFYEIQEDGRDGHKGTRMRCRPLAEPFRRAGKVDWSVTLERISEDRDRDGREQIGPNRGLR
jgi:hypothetical protein